MTPKSRRPRATMSGASREAGRRRNAHDTDGIVPDCALTDARIRHPPFATTRRRHHTSASSSGMLHHRRHQTLYMEA